MDLKLTGKVALVTGAAKETGREVALALGAEGATVAVNYRSSDVEAHQVVEEITSGGGTAKAYKADVGELDDVNAMVAGIVEDFGQIDILVNNAGFVQPRKFVSTTPEDWKRQIDVGLYGVIHCCHAVAPHMTAQKKGRIITLTGDSARVGEAGLSITASAKGGAISFSKSLAQELGRSGVTVNVVALGLIANTHNDPQWLEDNLPKILKKYPSGRLGTPEDVSPLVTFLVSDLTDWITGQVISANGGYSMSG